MTDAQHIQTPQRDGYGEIMNLAWPMILSMISFTVMGFVDTMFVSWLGPTQTAGVVLANVVLFQAVSLLMGLLAAIRTLNSQDFGAGRLKNIAGNTATGLTIALGLGLLMASMDLVRIPFLELVAGTDAQVRMAEPYLFWRFLGVPFVAMRVVCDNHFGAISDTRTPMVINIVANLLNVPFTYVLVFGFGGFEGMGVGGAGLSTLLSSMIAAGLGLSLLWLRSNSRSILSQGVFRPSTAAARRMMKVGLPLAMQFFLEVGSFNAINIMIARAGDVALAASGIVVQFIMISFLPAQGISGAATILVGQHQGAKRTDRAVAAVSRAVILSSIYMGICAGVFVLIPESLMSIFTEDTQVVTTGVYLLYIIAVFQVIDALGTVYYGALQGAGDTLWPMIFGIAGGWVIMVPTGFVLIQHFNMGVYGGWIAKAAHIIVFACALIYRYHSGVWKTMNP